MCQECFQSVRKASILLPQSGMACPFCRTIVKSHASIKLGGPRMAPRPTPGWPSGHDGNSKMAQDPLNLSDDLSIGEHRWFGDIAAQVAMAGMGGEAEAGSMGGGFETAFDRGRIEGVPPQGPDAGFDQRGPFAGYPASALGQPPHIQMAPLEANHVQGMQPHRDHIPPEGHGHPGWLAPSAGWNQQQQQQQQHFQQQHQQQQSLQFPHSQHHQGPHEQHAFGNGGMQWLGGHESPGDMAAGLQMQRNPQAVGLGGVPYMNDLHVNGGGRSWMNEHGHYGILAEGKHDERAQREMLSRVAPPQVSPGQEDGSGKILQMMFGVSLG